MAAEQRGWGPWALGLLTIAAASLIGCDVLRNNGPTLLSSVGLVIGPVGAVVCTVRGLRRSALPRR